MSNSIPQRHRHLKQTFSNKRPCLSTIHTITSQLQRNPPPPRLPLPHPLSPSPHPKLNQALTLSLKLLNISEFYPFWKLLPHLWCLKFYTQKLYNISWGCMDVGQLSIDLPSCLASKAFLFCPLTLQNPTCACAPADDSGEKKLFILKTWLHQDFARLSHVEESRSELQQSPQEFARDLSNSSVNTTPAKNLFFFLCSDNKVIFNVSQHDRYALGKKNSFPCLFWEKIFPSNQFQGASARILVFLYWILRKPEVCLC